MIRYGDYIGEWVAKQTGGHYCPGHSQAIGLFGKGNSIRAGVIFEGHTGKSIVAHIAVNGRLNREFLWAISDYAYRQLGVTKVIAPIWSNNSPMLDLAINMGFKMESVIEEAQPHGDGSIYFLTLHKDSCRFLTDRFKGGGLRENPSPQQHRTT